MSVVVWEWENNCVGQRVWIPYEPKVSNFIEKNYRLKNFTVDLRSVSDNFSIFQVDLTRNIQTTDYRDRSIQRSECPADSSAGRKVCWQWRNEVGRWHSYSVQLSDLIEHGLTIKTPISFLRVYTIDPLKLTQLNNSTHYERDIRRHTWQETYTQTTEVHLMAHCSSQGTFSNGKGDTTDRDNVNAVNDTKNRSHNSCLGKVKKLIQHKSRKKLKVKASKDIKQVDLDHLKVESMEESFGRFYRVVKKIKDLSETCPICCEDFNTPSGYFNGANNDTLEEKGSNNVNSGENVIKWGGKNCSSGSRGSGDCGGSGGNKDYDTTFTTNILSTTNITNTNIKNLNNNKNLNNPDNLYDITNNNKTSNNNTISNNDKNNNNNNTMSNNDKNNNNSSMVVVVLKRCKHQCHFLCLKAMLLHTHSATLQCPTCKHIYGTKYGNCPDGLMTYQVCKKGDLLGFEDGCGVVTVKYDIRDGLQKRNHPDPFTAFQATGFPRYGYLPNNEDGRKVLKLLIKAWERRLTFTIGTSVTTGAKGRVVWNEIHHKTEKVEQRGHGYPDANYISNVLAELCSQGVVDSEEEEDTDDAGGGDEVDVMCCDDDDEMTDDEDCMMVSM